MNDNMMNINMNNNMIDNMMNNNLNNNMMNNNINNNMMNNNLNNNNNMMNNNMINNNMNNIIDENQMKQQMFQQQMMAQPQMMNQQTMMSMSKLPKTVVNNFNNNVYSITFKQSNGQGVPIMMQCFPDEKISSIIEKYRILSGDDNPNCKFVFNSNMLNPNLNIEESGIRDNDEIFIIH